MKCLVFGVIAVLTVWLAGFQSQPISRISQTELTPLTTAQESKTARANGDLWINSDLKCVRQRSMGRNLCIASGNPVVVDCAALPGADAGAKLQACHNALPDAGGIMNARGITGTQFAAASYSGSSATGIHISKSNVTILLSPKLELSLFADTDTNEGLLITGSNVHVYGNGAILTATRSLASGKYFDYFLVRVRSFSGQPPVTGFVSEGVDYRLSVTGTPVSKAAEMGCLQLRADAEASYISDWSLRHNKCATMAAHQAGLDIRVYGFFAFTSKATVPIGRLIRNGEFIENNFENADGRLMQTFGAQNIIWRGNIIRNPSPGMDHGGVGIRAIASDHITIEKNRCEVITADGGFGCIYVGATEGVAGDESKGVTITGNEALFAPKMTSADTYALRFIGVHDAVVSGNSFTNTQPNEGGAGDGIKISPVKSNTNSNIRITRNQIKGFLTSQIRNDDPAAANVVAEGNRVGDSAAGKANALGGSYARLVIWRGNRKAR